MEGTQRTLMRKHPLLAPSKDLNEHYTGEIAGTPLFTDQPFVLPCLEVSVLG